MLITLKAYWVCCPKPLSQWEGKWEVIFYEKEVLFSCQ